MALPDLRLRTPPEDIAPLAGLLREAGYTESSVCELLEIDDLSLLRGDHLAAYVDTCRQADSTLSKLVAFFLLGENLSRREASALLGRELLTNLTLCGLIFRSSGTFFCHAVVYPCDGQYLVTDYWVSKLIQEGKIYELGTDSYVLSRVTSRKGYQKALDLCTGSGVHAVQSAIACQESSAVDINPRALEYTTFNAALNGTSCQTFLGNLYQPLPEGTYDLITANPPFVPSPDPDIQIHRSAGETGEEVSEHLVGGLPARLAIDGLFSMVLEYPVISDDDYLDRLERWLGETQGWGIFVLSYGEKEIEKYARLHVAPGEQAEDMVKAYLESYARQKIVAVDFANVFIMRHGGTQPNWKCRVPSVWPKSCRRESVAEWLAAQACYHRADWSPEPTWQPTLHPRFRCYRPGFAGQSGALELIDPYWLPVDPLSAEESEMLNGLKPGITYSQMLETWTASGKAEESLLETCRSLGRQMVLR